MCLLGVNGGWPRVMLEVKKQELLTIQILNDQTNNHSLVYYI